MFLEFIKKDKLFNMTTIQESVTMLYASISFNKDAHPNVDILKELFIEEGKLINNSKSQPMTYSVDAFIEAYSVQLRAGTIWQLREVEIHALTEEFGSIAHRFSTYALFVNNQEEPLSKGINSIQLIKENDRWKVSCLVWDEQKETLPIPEKYINPL